MRFLLILAFCKASLTKKWYPGRGSNPYSLWEADFKSAASAIPPPGHRKDVHVLKDSRTFVKIPVKRKKKSGIFIKSLQSRQNNAIFFPC